MSIRIWFFLIINILTSHSYASHKTPDFVIAPIPAWVKIIKDEEHSAIPDQETAHGINYHLIDKQIKKEKDVICYFTHVSKKIVNQNGVDIAARLELEFDPLCDSVVLHHVNIKRGTKVINHLSLAKIKVLQREKELEQKIYSGIKSISIILDDVRVGDIIDYSFTIKDSSPNINKSFYRKIYFSAPFPIHHLKQRILWPQDRPLSLKNHSETIKPRIEQHQNYTEYLWSMKNLPLDIIEPGTPDWYDADPWVEVSEKHSWHEINLLLGNRYKVSRDLSPLLQKHVDSIARTTKDVGERFICVMRFIQDDIRYMGMSDRIDGFQPGDAAAVFSRRFGDCKDKTFLALTMLKALGIEAYPAIVHTVHGKSLEGRLPNSAIFNHVIVVAIIDGKNYWIDPTISFQGGTLHDFVQPDYGYALILDGKSRGLTKIPLEKPSLPTVEIYETYDLSKGPNSPSIFTIKTLFKHRHADIQREAILTTPKKELNDSYIKSYQKHHPSIRAKIEPTITDDKKHNIITITEQYEIPNQWERDDSSEKWLVRSYADEFIGYLSHEDITKDRNAPIALLFPRYIFKKTEMILPKKEWDIDPEVITVIDPAFEFKKEEELKGSKFSISYTYKSLSSHVEPSMLDSYLKNTQQASDILGVTIQQFDEGVPTQTVTKKDTLNWPILLLMIIVFSVFIFMALKIYTYQPQAPLTASENPNLYGIKGWLIIPAIALLATPFRLIRDSWETTSLILSHNSWQEISSPDSDSFHSLLAPLICTETIGNIAFFVCSLLLLGLFFKKKRLLPRLYIYFLAGNFLWIVLDHAVTFFIFAIALTRSEKAQLVGGACGMLIWCTYMIKSKRVKATFVE